MADSTRRRRTRHHQSAKPYPDYPLTAHPSGRWCKKIRGKLHYFGPIDDWQAALDKWHLQRDDLLNGRTPRERTESEGPTLRDLGNAYMIRQRQQMDRGKIATVTFADSARTCKDLLAFFKPDTRCDDLLPSDFARYYAALEKRYSRTTVANVILRTRAVLNFAAKRWEDADGRPVLARPIRCGADFTPPDKQAIARGNERPERMLAVEEIRKLLDAADTQERAWILLACNGGMGNTDLARLPVKVIDLEAGWLDFARTKTNVKRRLPLWAETVEAIQAVLAARPTPDADARDCLFVMPSGRPWCMQGFTEREADGKTTIASRTYDQLSKSFARLIVWAGIERRAGVNFYSLRHWHRTTAADANDAEAADSLMGHKPAGMRERYVHKISDARLKRVTDHIHGVLFHDHKPA